jgi:hypothetical protein
LPAVELTRGVHGENVRVIQRGGSLRFSLKPPPRLRRGEFVEQKLDGHRPIETRVERTVDHAHTAGADLHLYVVHAEPLTDECLFVVAVLHPRLSQCRRSITR